MVALNRLLARNKADVHTPLNDDKRKQEEDHVPTAVSVMILILRMTTEPITLAVNVVSDHSNMEYSSDSCRPRALCIFV